MSERSDAARILREFIRRNGATEGAFDAGEALRTLESAADDTQARLAQESAYSVAIVGAQAAVRSAYKSQAVDLGGKGSYKVAETEQLLELCREAMAPFKLAIEVGNSEAVIVSNTPFARTGFGLRHELGFVHRVTRDFPLDGRGDQNKIWRGANTSSLGYFLRDAFALPRLKDEGEAAEARRATSGVRRPFAPAPTSSPQQGRSQGAPSAATKLGDRAEAVRQGIMGTKDLESLDKADAKVMDLRSALESDPEQAPYTSAEVTAFEKAVTDRRTQLEGGPTS